MSHYDILQSVHCCLANLRSFVRAKTMNPFKQDLPDLLEIDSIRFLLN